MSRLVCFGVAFSLGVVASAQDVLDERERPHLTNVRQLTRGGSNAECYWRPDGQGFIFQSTREPFAADQIFTMRADGAEQTLVSTGKGRTTCAYFFPDATRILFSSTHVFSDDVPPRPDRSRGYVWPCHDTYEIFTAMPDGGDLRRLTDNRAYDAEATICWKTGRIVFTSDRDGDLELYTMNLDGSDLRRVTNELGYDGGAFFSADGKRIVWRASRPKTEEEVRDYKELLAEHLVRPLHVEIWTADADGTGAQPLTSNGAANFAPYFFPDGKRIVFASNLHNPEAKSPDFDLYAMNADGSDLQRITYSAAFDAFPMFSPDGRQLVWISGRGAASRYEFNVFLADWVP